VTSAKRKIDRHKEKAAKLARYRTQDSEERTGEELNSIDVHEEHREGERNNAKAAEIQANTALSVDGT